MNSAIETAQPTQKRFNKLKMAAIVMTLCGIGLFALLVYSVGFHEILDGVGRFGFAGSAVILTIYFFRICVRSYAWKLTVPEPYHLTMRDTIPGVMIGEAMSSTLPLGLIISGTSKAVAVRKRVPLVAGLSSVATENLFYSFITGFHLILGALVMLRVSAVDDGVAWTINAMIVSLIILMFLGVMMVIRQWHMASWLCEFVYRKGFLTRLLENGRLQVRLFEDQIYGFYRRHPHRFIPICLLEATYHALGVAEVYYILSRLNNETASLTTAFLLESISRLVTIVFKAIPFNIGVDEAGAQYVGNAIALAAGVGVTLAIIRKGRILFWTALGWALIAKRGLSFKSLSQPDEEKSYS